MEESLIAIALILYFILAIFRRDWALYLLVVLLPSFQIRFQLLGLPMTLLESMILILFLVEGFYLWREKKLGQFWQKQIWEQKFRTILILIFLLSSSTAVLVSPVLFKAAGVYKAFFIEAVFFYCLLLSIVNSKKRFDGLINALSILVLLVSVFGLYQFLTLEGLNFTWWAAEIASRRIVSFLVYPNALGLLLGPLLALLIFLPKNKLRIYALCFGLPALYLSFSRGAWLALFVTVLGVGLLTPHWKKLLLAGFVAGLLILMIPYSRNKLVELALLSDPSQTSRFILWESAIDLIKKNPINGVGLMGFHEAYKKYPLGPDGVVHNYPHNIILNFWLEIGLSGLIAFLGIVIYFYKIVWRLLKTNVRTIALAGGASMAVILLHGLVDAPYFKNDLAVIFWLVFAIPNLNFDNLINKQKPQLGVIPK